MPGNRCKRPVSIEDIDNFPILLISIDAKLRGRKFGNGGKLPSRKGGFWVARNLTIAA